MQPEYLFKLSAHVRDLVEEVERTSGVPIVVTVSPEKNVVSCFPYRDRGEIFTPTPEALKDGPVVHEVLHLRRFLVEGIPRLVVPDDYEGDRLDPQGGVTAHDNIFEHCVIVPEEIRRCPDRQTYWEQLMLQRWRELESPQLDEAARREASVALWTFVRHVLPDGEALPVAAEILKRINYEALAEQFSAAVLPVLTNKERAIQTWWNQLGFDRNMVIFEYLDTRRATPRRVALVDIAN